MHDEPALKQFQNTPSLARCHSLDTERPPRGVKADAPDWAAALEMHWAPPLPRPSRGASVLPIAAACASAVAATPCAARVVWCACVWGGGVRARVGRPVGRVGRQLRDLHQHQHPPHTHPHPAKQALLHARCPALPCSERPAALFSGSALGLHACARLQARGAHER